MSNKRSDRQIEIIEAAGKILTQSGVSGLTTKNLAAEMNFSESAIYRHFSGKEEIIVAMLNYLAESMEKGYTNACQSNESVEERFRCLFHVQCGFFHDHPHFVAAVFSDGLMEQSNAINEAILQLMQLKIKYLIPILTEGQAKGIFKREVNADDLASIVMGAFRLQMFQWKINGFSSDIKAKGNSLTNSLLTLIKSN
jgi:AcrR family transcriptional regulator